MESLPVAERTRPRKIVDFKPYSVVDLIREVEYDSDVGKKYVFEEAKRLGYLVE